MEQEENWFRKHWILLIILAVIGIIILSFILLTNLWHNHPIIDNNYTPNPEIYQNDIYKFSIVAPLDWTIIDNPNAGGITMIVAFMGPTTNGFRTNINIKTENAQGYTLDQYILASKQTLASYLSMNDYILIEEGDLTIGGQNSYFLEYAANSQGYPFETKQIILMNGDNAYILTYTALQNTFGYNVDDFDRSVSTFRFIK